MQGSDFGKEASLSAILAQQRPPRQTLGQQQIPQLVSHVFLQSYHPHQNFNHPKLHTLKLPLLT